MNPKEILKTANTILVIDWPSKDVPESLARAGFQVIVKGGPGPGDYCLRTHRWQSCFSPYRPDT
jgi:hypothetical protein